MTIIEHDNDRKFSGMPAVPVFETGHTLSSRTGEQSDAVRLFGQSIHTQVYLENHFIDQSDLDEDGLFTDQYSDRSTYLIAENGKRYTTCRYVSANKKRGIMSLPTAEHFSLDAEEVQKTAGIRLADLKASEVIEVSGLASVKRDNPENEQTSDLNVTWLLYSAILRDSLDQGHKLWLLNTHESLTRSLEKILGSDQVHRLGSAMEYMGSPTVPVAMNPQSIVQSILNDDSAIGVQKRKHLEDVLPGVSADKLSKETKAALDRRGIPYVKTPVLERVVKSPKTWANSALGVYAVARAAPLPAIDQFHGDWRVFMAVDLATVAPYTWGLAETAMGSTRGRRLAGAATAVTSFAAPYGYLFTEGDNYPPYVTGIVGAFVAVAGLQEVAKNRKNKRIFRGLRASEQ